MLKTDATKYGEALQKTLNENFGGEWNLRIWDNLGWHYSCRKGGIKVHRSHYFHNPGMYHVYFGHDCENSGGFWVESSMSIQEAMTKVLQEASEWFEDKQKMVREGQAILNAAISP